MISRITICTLMIALLSFGFAGCKKTNEPGGKKVADGSGTKAGANSLVGSYDGLTEVESKIKRLTDSESLIQSFSGQMKTLAKSVRDRSTQVGDFVNESIEYNGFEDSFDLDSKLSSFETDKESGKPVNSFYVPVGANSNPVPFSKIWEPILSKARFTDSQFGTLSGQFSDDFTEFEMETKFEGRVSFNDGTIGGAKGIQTLTWRLSESDAWMLVGWKQTELKLIAAKQVLFEDVTESAFPDEATREKVASSSHQDLIRRLSKIKTGKFFKDARKEYKSFSDWESTFQYPGVSVVDIDQDGFEDVFISDRWQPAQLLRNKGDGTFEDITKASGLDVPELANCACFADFDNDGDKDVFVGRSMGPSLYFVNEDGVFKPETKTNKELEESRFVVCGSVVDINNDGLLDLYLSTYAYGAGKPADWANQTTFAADQTKTRLKMERSHTYVDRHGPPNFVLMNRGGTFERVRIGDELKQFRNSYQSGWKDLDDDGDLDVYICNDFSPDVFLRNDTERGSFELKFTDITEELAGKVMGFGMGVSWGDYNNDGDLDLYVSNMYSKAGNRIVKQVDGVDERIKVSARGNFLYENVDGKFEQVAGTGDSEQHVSIVGWAFGGQFADFNNDGNLDIYVPTGFYTPPVELLPEVDL